MISEEVAHTKDARALYKAIASLQTPEEVRRFMRDLMTIQEIAEAVERWKVAGMVDKGIPYRAIAEQTGVSTATITRIAQWLNNGEGGYRLVLNKQS